MSVTLDQRIIRLMMVVGEYRADESFKSADNITFYQTLKGLVVQDVPVLIEELRAKDEEMERLRKIEQAAAILVDMSILPENEGAQEWVESRYVNALRKTLGQPGIPFQIIDPKEEYRHSLDSR